MLTLNFIKYYTKSCSGLHVLVTCTLTRVAQITTLYKYNYQGMNFFREGMFLDCLQKLSTDKLIKKLYIQSIQFFNLNYYNYKLIKFLIDEVYKIYNFFFNKGDDLNYHNIIWNILFFMIWLFQLLIIIYINIFFLLY